MLEVSIPKNQILPFSIDSHNFKDVEELDEDKNFQSILEGLECKKEVPSKQGKKTTESRANTEIDKEISDHEDLTDLIANLIELFMDIKSNYKELDNIDCKDVLTKLEKSCQILETILDTKEPIHFNNEDVVSLLKVIEQTKEIINEEIFKENNIDMKFKDIMKQIEEKTSDILDLSEAVSDSINKEELFILEEDRNIEKNTHTHIDYEVEEKDLNQDIEISEDKEQLENNLNFANEEPVEDGELQSTTTDSNYSFNIITKDTIDTVNIENTVEGNSIQDFEGEDLIQQIVEKIEVSESMDKQEVKIRLKPDYLGELVVKMEVKEGSIQAKLLVDNYRTKDVIESNLFQLKEQFEENGMDIKTFEVFVGTNEDFEREKRNRYFFNKNPSKLKTGIKIEEELKAYNNSFVKEREDLYHEGRLNLFV